MAGFDLNCLRSRQFNPKGRLLKIKDFQRFANTNYANTEHRTPSPAMAGQSNRE
jgi:hypothetical protein